MTEVQDATERKVKRMRPTPRILAVVEERTGRRLGPNLLGAEVQNACAG